MGRFTNFCFAFRQKYLKELIRLNKTKFYDETEEINPANEDQDKIHRKQKICFICSF